MYLIMEFNGGEPLDRQSMMLKFTKMKLMFVLCSSFHETIKKKILLK